MLLHLLPFGRNLKGSFEIPNFGDHVSVSGLGFVPIESPPTTSHTSQFTGNDVTGYMRSTANRIGKRVHLGSCSSGDFLITVQPILKKFRVLEIVI